MTIDLEALPSDTVPTRRAAVTTTSRCCSSPRGRPARRRPRCSPTGTSPRTSAGPGPPRAARRPDDVGLGVLPFFHVFGLNVALGVGLAAGARPRCSTTSTRPTRRRSSASHGVTILAGSRRCSPACLELPTRGRRRRSRSVRLAVSGARRAPARRGRGVPRPLRRRGPRGLRPHRGVADRHHDRGRRPPPAPGRSDRRCPASRSAWSTTTATTCSPATRARSGCGARTSSPATGRRRRDRARAGTDGWLRTGDVAVADDDGCLSLVDRAKDLIIVSGFNVFPAEVEDVAARHVDGWPTRRGRRAAPARTGETVVAWVVARAAAVTLDPSRCSRHASRPRLARYKFPDDGRPSSTSCRGRRREAAAPRAATASRQPASS